MEDIVQRLTAFRLRMMRDLAMRALEMHYKHLPEEVRKALRVIIEAVLQAEEAVVVWQFKQKDDED